VSELLEVITSENGTVEIHLKGECDLSTLDELNQALERGRASGKPVLVEMSALEFLDSSCLEAILRATEATEAGLVLRGLGGEPRRIFEIAGLLDRVTIED
jgi:anti-anti-sigma factor